ncbi:hypothetical protein C8Q72DRAFT_119138 [Fomitopsis betulina]|nr:hypothetical protein C8Q72DRAFT_119138 [Fomitopsis betulina]
MFFPSATFIRSPCLPLIAACRATPSTRLMVLEEYRSAVGRPSQIHGYRRCLRGYIKFCGGYLTNAPLPQLVPYTGSLLLLGRLGSQIVDGSVLIAQAVFTRV